MARFGYVFSSDISDSNRQYDILASYGCDEIKVESPEYEHDRPVWKSLLRSMSKGDELFIIKINTAIRSIDRLAIFFKLVQLRRIRLVSVTDQIDTMEEIFPAPSVNRWIDIISSLPMESAARRIDSAQVVHEVMSTSIKSKRKQRQQRNANILNAYNTSVPVSEIVRRFGVNRTLIYRVLRQNKITPSRLSNPTSSSQRKELARQMIAQNKSPKDIQEALGYKSLSSVYLIIKKLGLDS